MPQRVFEISAPREIVYEVVSDFEKYPEFLNTADHVSVEQVDGATEVLFELNVIKKIQYRLKFDLKPPEGLSWELVKGDMMKKNSGSWHLEDLGDNRTRATYMVDVEFGWMVPKGMVGKLTESQLPTLLESFTKRSEKVFKEKSQNV